jgi:ribonuclease E
MAEEEKPSLRKRFRIATFSASEDSPTPVVETPVGSPSVAFQQAVVPPRTPGANKPESENKEERGLLRRARGVKRRRDNEEEVESKDSKENSFTKDDDSSEANHRRVRKRVRATEVNSDEVAADDPNTVVRVRAPRERTPSRSSTRIDAKRQRRKDGRDSGRRRTPVLTEAEFLARRESVDRVMVVRQNLDRIQIAVLEDNMLVEHYVSRGQSASLIGNVYLGKVQNVLPSMEAAFIDIGRGRNGVLYAGEVNWDAAGLDGQPKRIELALKTNDSVLVQVTKDPVGQKGARLTSQISLPGRYLVYVPDGSVTGISRKLPDVERTRLKRILRNIVPEGAGVIVRTAAEGATEEQLQKDVARLQAQWENIQNKTKDSSPASLLYSEPDLAIRVVRDIFNEDFKKLIVAGNEAWDTIEEYVKYVAPDLADRLEKWNGEGDVFAANRIDEQISKALDRKVYLPSGGSLVIDRTEAMTVIDVNTGKFIGQGGNLEETVTKNNLEAAEEIVRQLRLRDVGGIIVIDFIDMVLESNRDQVLRRLVECLGRDRTKHQVAEVSSLGLVQMTRKRISTGLLETFSEACEHCNGRGVKVFSEPVDHKHSDRRFKRENTEATEANSEETARQ